MTDDMRLATIWIVFLVGAAVAANLIGVARTITRAVEARPAPPAEFAWPAAPPSAGEARSLPAQIVDLASDDGRSLTSAAAAAVSPFPPPLRGRAREGGVPTIDASVTPLSTSPPQGGREPAVIAAALVSTPLPDPPPQGGREQVRGAAGAGQTNIGVEQTNNSHLHLQTNNPQTNTSHPWLREARRWLGRDGRLVGMRKLWCARFMNFVLKRTGHRGTGSDWARSFLKLPKVSPQVGAIAVLARGRRGGHVGVVAGFDRRGNVLLVSGNHGRRVAQARYPKRRVIAYVVPKGRGS